LKLGLNVDGMLDYLTRPFVPQSCVTVMKILSWCSLMHASCEGGISGEAWDVLMRKVVVRRCIVIESLTWSSDVSNLARARRRHG
jgi:hypothetical protein